MGAVITINLEVAGGDAVILKNEQFERADSKLAPDLLDKIFPPTILTLFEPLQILDNTEER